MGSHLGSTTSWCCINLGKFLHFSESQFAAVNGVNNNSVYTTGLYTKNCWGSFCLYYCDRLHRPRLGADHLPQASWAPGLGGWRSLCSYRFSLSPRHLVRGATLCSWHTPTLIRDTLASFPFFSLNTLQSPLKACLSPGPVLGPASSRTPPLALAVATHLCRLPIHFSAGQAMGCGASSRAQLGPVRILGILSVRARAGGSLSELLPSSAESSPAAGRRDHKVS